jgi:hypothetical protein
VPVQSEANPRIKQRAAVQLGLLSVDFGALSLHCNALPKHAARHASVM